jgi:hypothetical protein
MNRKILFQVAAPALLIGLLLVGACLVSAWSIDRLQMGLARILSRNVASIQAARDLENKMRQLRYHSLIYVYRPAPDYLAQVQHDEQGFEEALAQARATANTPEEDTYLEGVRDRVGLPPVPRRDGPAAPPGGRVGAAHQLPAAGRVSPHPAHRHPLPGAVARQSAPSHQGAFWGFRG